MTLEPWAARRARAARLLREAPHAEELLVFYVALIEIQEGVARGLPDPGSVFADEPTDDAPLAPSRLAPVSLVGPFRSFVSAVSEVGTDVLVSRGRELLDVDGDELGRVIVSAEGFHARAFLEPLLTSLAASLPAGPRASEASDAADPGSCPRCGAPPVVGALRDLPDALGARSLVCPLCATEWRFDRLRCPACLESDPDRLVVHEAESPGHVRIEECLACRRYVKTIDLRARGDAIPVVDDLATVELDLWSRDRGLERLQDNVLGL